MSRLVVSPTPLAGLSCVQRLPLADDRGFFSRLFCAAELAPFGWTGPVAQINQTRTLRKGCVRGMHFQQSPHAEAKFVSCVRGEVWDVALDLRHGSPTFLHWHAQRLSAENMLSLLIPPGFAHGFQTLSDEVEMIYCHSVPYAASADAGLNPLDPRLAIRWPLPVIDLSAKDAGREWIDHTFEGVHL